MKKESHQQALDTFEENEREVKRLGIYWDMIDLRVEYLPWEIATRGLKADAIRRGPLPDILRAEIKVIKRAQTLVSRVKTFREGSLLLRSSCKYLHYDTLRTLHKIDIKLRMHNL